MSLKCGPRLRDEAVIVRHSVVSIPSLVFPPLDKLGESNAAVPAAVHCNEQLVCRHALCYSGSSNGSRACAGWTRPNIICVATVTGRATVVRSAASLFLRPGHRTWTRPRNARQLQKFLQIVLTHIGPARLASDLAHIVFATVVPSRQLHFPILLTCANQSLGELRCVDSWDSIAHLDELKAGADIDDAVWFAVVLVPPLLKLRVLHIAFKTPSNFSKQPVSYRLAYRQRWRSLGYVCSTVG
jgi:hypothetical protein